MALPRIGVRAVYETAEFDAGLRRYQSGLATAEQQTRNFATQQTSTFRQMSTGIGQLIASVGAGGLARTSVMTAARVQELGVVLQVVGRNAGYSKQELEGYVSGVKEMNITSEAAYQTIVRMIQGEMDLTQATKLARVAQDAAVIAQEDSSATLDALIYGITNLEPMVLRSRGLIVSLDRAYEDWAEAQAEAGRVITGPLAQSMTVAEKRQAMFNATLKAASSIAGAYAAAMTMPGKQLRSMTRLVEEAQVAMGQGLLPAFGVGVQTVSALLKVFLQLPPALQATIGAGLGVAAVFAGLGGVITLFGPGLAILGGGLTGAARGMLAMVGVATPLVGVEAVLTAEINLQNAALVENNILWGGAVIGVGAKVGELGALAGAEAAVTQSTLTTTAAVGGLRAAVGGLSFVAAATGAVWFVNELVAAADKANLVGKSIKDIQRTVEERKQVVDLAQMFDVSGAEEGANAYGAAVIMAARAQEVLIEKTGGAKQAEKALEEQIDAVIDSLQEEERAVDRTTNARDIAAAVSAVEARGLKIREMAEKDASAAIWGEVEALRARNAALGYVTSFAPSAEVFTDFGKRAAEEAAQAQLGQQIAVLDLDEALRQAERSSRGLGGAQSGMENQVKDAEAALDDARNAVSALTDELNIAQRAVQDYTSTWFVGEAALRGAILNARQRVIELQLAEEGATKQAKESTNAYRDEFDMLAAQQREIREGVPVLVSLREWQNRRAKEGAQRTSEVEKQTALDAAQDALRRLELQGSLNDLQRERLRLLAEDHPERTYAEAAAGIELNKRKITELAPEWERANAQIEVQEALVSALKTLQEGITAQTRGQVDLTTELRNRRQDILNQEADRIAKLKIISDLMQIENKDTPWWAEQMRKGNAELDVATGKLKLFGQEMQLVPPLKMSVDDANFQEKWKALSGNLTLWANRGIAVRFDGDMSAFVARLSYYRLIPGMPPYIATILAQTQTQAAEQKLRELSAPLTTTLTVEPPKPVEVQVVADTSALMAAVSKVWKMFGGTPSFQSGERAVPGPVGAPQAAIVHGGERILSPLGGAGTTNNYNTYNYAPTISGVRGDNALDVFRREMTFARLTGKPRW